MHILTLFHLLALWIRIRPFLRKTERGPTKKLDDSVRYRIEEVGPDGEPLAPADVKKKFVKACGTLVRDNIQITIREWMQPKDPTISFVCDTMKDRLWNMLMHNFLLRMPEVDNPVR